MKRKLILASVLALALALGTWGLTGLSEEVIPVKVMMFAMLEIGDYRGDFRGEFQY